MDLVAALTVDPCVAGKGWARPPAVRRALYGTCRGSGGAVVTAEPALAALGRRSLTTEVFKGETRLPKVAMVRWDGTLAAAYWVPGRQ